MRLFKFSKFSNFCLKEKFEKIENLRFLVHQDFLKFEKIEKY